MTLPVFRVPGEVFCKMSISLGVCDVFFHDDTEIVHFGRKIMEVMCLSHHIIS